MGIPLQKLQDLYILRVLRPSQHCSGHVEAVSSPTQICPEQAQSSVVGSSDWGGSPDWATKAGKWKGENDHISWLISASYVAELGFKLATIGSAVRPTTNCTMQPGSPYISQHMRKGYLSHRRPEQAQASLHISTVLPEPLLLTDM